MTRYRTIVADPPWDYGSTFTKKLPHERHQKGAECPYDCMSTEQIAHLPVPDLAEDDAHLYLWTTIKFVEDAYGVCRAWGFRPATFLTWTKTHQADPTRVSMKVGHYFRGATEHLVFGVRGSLDLHTKVGLPTGYLWPRLPHSVKPDAFYDLVEKASPGPYVELFARRARFGWDYWGDQSLGTAELPEQEAA
jgi:N6-adenosine-specific RNA methylase IME4